MADKIRFYLDENVPIAISVQLKRRHIDAVTVRDLGVLGDSDVNHLRRATEMGYVLCTHDVDYIELAATGTAHTGIVFGQQHRHNIGDWVRFLELLHTLYESDEMRNRIEYV
ncbi:MAG: DUF5615 family PIN-like protein [Anaerolineaceae bacterium]|nr:DUF5615 family PIN-like protein [Anaerolineaceae bacterium]MCB9100791.1 DUF5615 family PIN-like protein [Anaerolineales bacterium]